MVSVRGVRLLLVTLVVVTCGSGCRAAPAPAADVPLVISVVGPEPEAASARAAQPAGGTSYSMLGDMQMTFFSSNTFDLWFEAFHVHDAGTLAAACIGIVISSALYEGLKVGRVILADKIDSAGFGSFGHWMQMCLHVAQVTIGYFLMLATMTYSSYLMICLCGGAGLGYAFFSLLVPKKTLLGGSTEHCH